MVGAKQDRTAAAFEIVPGAHVAGDFGRGEAGPTMIVFGGLHGNEAGGANALRRVAEKMHERSSKLHGRLLLLFGNTRALIEGVRFIDSDLNRYWTRDNVERNRPDSGAAKVISEDHEQSELLTVLWPAIAAARTEVYAIDLHSTSAEGVPFATVGDTMRNRRFARMLPVTILLGIEEQLEGTLLEYLNNLGAVTLGYEAGQHYADSTVDNHEALVWLALRNAGMLDAEGLPDERGHVETLRNATGKPRIVEIRYRHAIKPEDGFSMKPGFNNFDPVQKGDHLADDAGGTIPAGETGMVLMPLYQKLGEDGFFLGREVAPFWLKLSAVLRKLKIASLMPLAPGVYASAADRETLEIDTRIARFFPLQIFHLLGFRRRRLKGNKLVVSRRRFDTFSPFADRA
jgi:succinylglutamate desuccinylase